MPGNDWPPKLQRGTSLLCETAAAGLADAVAGHADAVAALCHLLVWRQPAGPNVPLVGIIGSASCGKSTLFNSAAQRDISAVTPIPHQTTGPILAAPHDFAAPARDEAFLRPAVEAVVWQPDASGLVGDPKQAAVVPAWDASTRSFVLIDLPDIGTVDSDEERRVALRILPWLDRVILVLTEESFAQAEHETIRDGLRLLQPERARAELLVALNRRHSNTTNAEFADRQTAVRELWPEALSVNLPHLAPGERFSEENLRPLLADAQPRTTRVLQAAIRHLARQVADEVTSEAATRRDARRALANVLRSEIDVAARFRKSFFSDEFKAQLDAFSPWRMSVEKLRSVVGRRRRSEAVATELISPDAVARHVRTATADLRSLAKRVGEQSVITNDFPLPPDEQLDKAVGELVTRINVQARRDVETLLTTLQEHRKIKDPLWATVSALASSLFLVDLFLPGLGTATSLTVLGGLSALGFGGYVAGEAMRQLRTSHVRETFETGLRQILQEGIRPWTTAPARAPDVDDLAVRLTSWARDLPED